MSLIDTLKPRSGKSLKFRIVEKTSIGDGSYVALLLCNADSRISIILKQETANNCHLNKDETVFVQNLEFVESIEGIDIFKISNIAKNCLKKSRKQLKECLQYSATEVDRLKLVDVTKYAEDHVEGVVIASTSEVQVQVVPLNMTLFEFCKGQPQTSKQSSFVEVKHIKQSFTPTFYLYIGSSSWPLSLGKQGKVQRRL